MLVKLCLLLLRLVNLVVRPRNLLLRYLVLKMRVMHLFVSMNGLRYVVRKLHRLLMRHTVLLNFSRTCRPLLLKIVMRFPLVLLLRI